MASLRTWPGLPLTVNGLPFNAFYCCAAHRVSLFSFAEPSQGLLDTAASSDHGNCMQMYEHEQKKHRETEELRVEEARVQQQQQRLRQVRQNAKPSPETLCFYRDPKWTSEVSPVAGALAPKCNLCFHMVYERNGGST